MPVDDWLGLWMDGALAGHLMRSDDGTVEFAYDDDYRGNSTSTPVSLSMPLTTKGHGPAAVMPWLSNLLPDDVEVRDRWAAKFGERSNDPFTLLGHMGQDAPGAVQFTRPGVHPDQEGRLTPIPARRIGERVRAIIDDPGHWVDDSNEDESRFSLGGNQGKFALESCRV